MRAPLAVPMVALAMTVCGSIAPAAAQPVVGGLAPGFELPSLEGELVDLGDFAGQHVVLHFGAGW